MKMTMLGFKVAKLTIAGPGHKPLRPHPTPNSIAPIIRRASIIRFVGIENDDSNSGFWRDKTNL